MERINFQDAYEKILESKGKMIAVDLNQPIAFTAIGIEAGGLDRKARYIRTIDELEREVKNVEYTGVNTVFLSPTLTSDKSVALKVKNMLQKFHGRVFMQNNPYITSDNTIGVNVDMHDLAGIEKQIAEYNNNGYLTAPALSALTGYSALETLYFLKLHSQLSEQGKKFSNLLESGKLTIEDITAMTGLTITATRMNMDPAIDAYLNNDKELKEWFVDAVKIMLREARLDRREMQYEKREEEIIYHVDEKMEKQENALFGLMMGVALFANTSIEALKTMWTSKTKAVDRVASFIGEKLVSPFLAFVTAHSAQPDVARVVERGNLTEKALQTAGWFAFNRAANADMNLADRINNAVIRGDNNLGI